MDKPKRDEKSKRGLRRSQWLILALALVVVLLVGAGLYIYENSRICGCAPNPHDATMTAAATLPVTPIPDCVIDRAYGYDDIAARNVVSALERANITGASAQVRFDGEDSVCYENGARTSTEVLIRYLYPAITIPMPEPTTREAKGRLMERILIILESLHYIYLEQVEINFQAADGTTDRWTGDFRTTYEALKKGATGAALFGPGY
jgi:hypothetical protein